MTTIALLAVAFCGTGTVAANAAAPVMCGGKVATIIGTDGRDQLTGTAGDDVISGLGNGDVINGLGGNDTICGDSGMDVISGGDGNDVIFGGEDNDSITGDAGNDVVNGDNGNDSVSGNDGNDQVNGGDGNDSLYGNDGADVILGGPGRDSIDGGTTADTCLNDPTDSLTGCETVDTGAGERPGYTQLSSPLSDRVTAQVNPGTGNLELRSTDLNIRGTGLSYTVTRYWNSLAVGAGAFGANGTMSNGADVKLTIGADGTITYRAPSGFTAAYAPNGAGGYTSPSTYQAADLTKTTTTYVLTFHGSNEKLAFTASGRLTSDADKSGNTNTFAYNSDGTLQKVTDTQGRVTTFSYTSGRITETTDPSGRHTLYSYDSAGNLTKVTDATGAVWQFQYWEGNTNLNQITDPRGNAETFTYDTNHRVVSATYSAYNSSAATTTYAYNLASTVVTDPLGHAATYALDNNERATSVIDALGNKRTSTFDATGNVTARTDPSAAVTNYTYLSGGRLATAQMPSETTSGGSTTPGAMTTVAYGNSTQPYLPSQVTDPQGGQTRYGYNAVGSVTSTSTFNPDGSATSANNTATSKYQGDPDGANTVNCGAKPGELCTSTNPRGAVTSYSYDSAGNVTTITPPAPLGKTTYGYDNLSRPTTITDGKGVLTTINYDADDRVLSTTTNGAVITYTYDPSGDLTSRHDGTGTTTWTYNSTGHLTSKAAPNTWTRTYTYDTAGNLTTSSDSGGPAGTTKYTYDAINEPITVADPAATVTLTWNKTRQTATALPSGVTQSVTYDNAGRPVRTTVTKNGTTLIDQAGAYQTASGIDRELLQTLRDNTAGTTTSYTYDGLNRLIRAQTTGTSNADYQFTLDPAGNRTQSYTTGTYSAIDTFNNADQLVNRGGAAFGGYDANGNATSDGSGQAYTYSTTNQNLTIKPPTVPAIAFTYADGDQTDRIAVGGTTSVNGILGVDQDTTSSKTTFYTRTPSGQLVSQRTPSGTYFYLYDLRGSVIGLTDSSGTRVNSYSYDPYGNQTSSASAAPIANPWRYNAGYLDNATGLYHFGARYYDPKLGRFTQADPSGKESNTYLFAGSDPVNNADPSGLGFCAIGHNPDGSCRGADEARGCLSGAIVQGGIGLLTGGGALVLGGLGCAEGIFTEAVFNSIDDDAAESQYATGDGLTNLMDLLRAVY